MAVELLCFFLTLNGWREGLEQNSWYSLSRLESLDHIFLTLSFYKEVKHLLNRWSDVWLWTGWRRCEFFRTAYFRRHLHGYFCWLRAFLINYSPLRWLLLLLKVWFHRRKGTLAISFVPRRTLYHWQILCQVRQYASGATELNWRIFLVVKHEVSWCHFFDRLHSRDLWQGLQMLFRCWVQHRDGETLLWWRPQRVILCHGSEIAASLVLVYTPIWWGRLE